MPIKYVGYQSKPWVVTFRHPWSGSRKVKSFSTEAEAADFEKTQIALYKHEKMILKKARKAKAAHSRITVRELLDSFFALASTNSTTQTTERYHCVPIIDAFGGRMASLLAPADMLNFTEIQRGRGVSQSTIHRRVSILRRALNWGVANGLLPKNPLAELRLSKSSSRRIAPPSPKEAKAIMAHAAPHVQRVIILGMCTGARIGPSELFRLTWADVDLENAICRMPSAKKNPHGADARDIPIKKSLVPIMQAWLNHDHAEGAHYVVHWKSRPIKSLGKSWRQALKRAGICRRIRPYDLRHAYATYSLAAGADIKTVADIMDHSDASMILKTYQHVLEGQKRDAVEAMPDHLGLLKAMNVRNIPGVCCTVI